MSYASEEFISARHALCKSAINVGFDEVRQRGPADLDSDFCEKNEGILKEKRGAGYWLWKPEIILQELKTLKIGDVLVYCDAGRSNYYQLNVFPSRLIKEAIAKGFLLGPTIGQHGPTTRWTKRDAFILMDMDNIFTHEKPLVQAGWSIWTPVPESFEFLKEWLFFCSDARILTDMENTLGLPNYCDFIDHRHDQSVLTLLAYKKGAPYLNFCGSLIEKILKMRPNSKLAHYFLRKIDDAEILIEGDLLRIIVKILSTQIFKIK
ncbi:hypothetical protein [Limnohabitans sp. Jir72]|uniref:hypothetical protein n=1 Tax=Limnohabitans sp. Jir72 TaxID=1977909 RepID=UPI0011B2440D|nr:hypothetical protein [Limnohabitans sp. Jir72]